ncbi:ABC transporter ATP-binding protein [Methylophaga frappieri]|uniref:ABC transporter ATP-binding protein n=1 Tax=Methylophaga frappieri (strain ATCC BAA-2434 / DSM 25690 / JAM7) TaxID=754477 RepID=I1YF74_METFJ|nr:ABC transporter ATP-binding protein [Methylophaga frappieri]AFJ01567.1 ABC transporter ATP-binding protein [Methylophaga frappieri]
MQLTIKNISKTYSNGVHALKQVNLTIGQGMFGLLGPNGAGKSSIIRTLATLQEPDEGEILFDGWNILKNPQKFRRLLGYLPQDFGVYPNASAVELLNYFARLKGFTDARKRQQQVHYLLDLVNLTSARNKNVDTFSGGMRQRFGIAQTLISDPKVIIVDEPTAGLDPAERNRFYGILHRLGDQAIVILSTHIVGDVTNLCRDMAILSQGQILARGVPATLIADIEGQLWRKTVTPEQLEHYRGKYKVIATRLQQGEVQVIIQSQDNPGEGFIPKAADLEDFYFSYIPELAI